jgi:glycogen debranching enzyme
VSSCSAFSSEGGPIRLELRPALQFRGHDEPVSTAIPEAYPLHAVAARIELAAPLPLPPLRLHLTGERTSFVIEPMAVPDIAYATEESRGYASRGKLYSPGRFRATIGPGGEAALVADRRTLERLLPALVDIVEHHVRGTRFGIRVDPRDGLLHQGADGYQLTWMDAKAGDWVVTPRRGKAVEINALWYNALRLLQGWLTGANERAAASRMQIAAERAYEAFNRRFWNPERGHLHDVVDGENGDDPACRPNQLFAISLANPVLAPDYWKPVVETVARELLTPVGLRSLSPRHPDFKPTYRGDLLTRDAAYHQGTVWSWLIGPYVDAVLRVHAQDVAGARRLLDGLIDNLGDNCIGFVGEVFDAGPPYTPGGCVAQAWGVGELLRCLLLTER